MWRQNHLQIHNSFHLSHSNIGNIYVMYIHLLGRHCTVNPFHPQAFLSEQSLQVCPYFVFSGLFLDDMQLLCSTSPGFLYRLEFISFTRRLFLVYQQGFFCQQVFLWRSEYFHCLLNFAITRVLRT